MDGTNTRVTRKIGRGEAGDRGRASARPRAFRAALAAAAAGLALAVAGAPVARAADHEEPRVVVVTGQGEVRAQPDLAIVTLGVMARKPTLEAARQEANRVQAALLAVTRALGVPDAQVRSTRISVQPEYVWNEPKRQREFTGYVVQRQLIVDLRDVDKLGPLMEKSITAGANLVQDPVLDSTKRKDYERQALELAVEDARKNADVLARSVGMAVGPARTVQGNGSFQGPMPVMAMARRGGAAAPAQESPETYQTGELVFGASANVTYDLVAATK